MGINLYYCLDSFQLESIIEKSLKGSKILDEYLNSLYEASQNWLCELGVVNYSFSLYLERNKNIGINRKKLIKQLFLLSDQMNVTVHEVDLELIGLAMKTIPHETLSIEENLIELQSDVVNHDYSRALRY